MLDLNYVTMVVKSWLRSNEDEEGQGLVEYGLIIVLVSIVVVAALTAVGGQLNNVFNNIVQQLAIPSA